MASNFVIDYLLTVKSESDRGVFSKLTLLLDFLVIFMTNFSDFIINDNLLHSFDGIVSIVVIWCSETITIIIIWVPAQPDKTLVNKFTNIGYKWNLFNIRNQTWCYCDKMICEALCWLSYDIIIVQQFCKSVNWITVSLKVLKQVKREVHHECNKFHCCCVWVPCAGYLTFFSWLFVSCCGSKCKYNS